MPSMSFEGVKLCALQFIVPSKSQGLESIAKFTQRSALIQQLGFQIELLMELYED